MSWAVEIAAAVTDATIDRFDCNISQLSSYIGKAGSLAATIPIPNQQIGDRCQAIKGRGGQLTAYVYHDNELWWGGTVSGTPLKGGGRHGSTMGITGATVESYLDRREIRTDTTWTDIEQVEILRGAWNSVQNTADGNLGIDVPTIPATGVTRRLKVLRSEARTWGSAVAEIAAPIDGLEWLIDVYADGNGTRHRQLIAGSPKIGRASRPQLFAFPGSILDYSLDWDALAGATSFQARGDAVGALSGNQRQPLLSTAGAYDATDLLAHGMLRFDATVDHSGAKLPSQVNGYAQRDLAKGAGAIPIIDISVGLAGFNRSILGSVFTATIDDFAFKRGPNGEPGYSSRNRCIGYEITPAERGNPDQAHLIIEAA
jgi:hypothetical protein